MHNGNGANGRNRDRFAPARNQKKYREREKNKIQHEKHVLMQMAKAIMKNDGFSGDSPEEFLKLVMVHLMADWLAAHWKSETRKDH